MNNQEALNEGIKQLAIAREAMKKVRDLIEERREVAKAEKDDRYPVLARIDAKTSTVLSKIEEICADSFDLQGDDVSVFTGGGGK